MRRPPRLQGPSHSGYSVDRLRRGLEAPDERRELLGGAGELLGAGGDLLRRGAGLLGRGADLLRAGGAGLGHGGDFGDVVLHALGLAGDLADRRGDLGDAAGHGLDADADLLERLARVLDRGDAVLGALGTVGDHVDDLVGLGLDLADERGDLARGALGLLGELADLLGDDGEAAALLAGASGLDRGVERQEVGLLGDAGDGLDDAADALGALGELADRLGHLAGAVGDLADRFGRLLRSRNALLGNASRLLGHLSGLLGALRAVLGDLRRAGRGLAGRLDHAHLTLGALRDVAHRGGDLTDRTAGLVRGGRHLLRGGGHRAGGRRNVADDVAERLARRVVGLDGADGADADLVDGGRDPAELVLAGVLDRRRDRRDLDRQVAVGHTFQRRAQVRRAVIAQHPEPVQHDR